MQEIILGNLSLWGATSSKNVVSFLRTYSFFVQFKTRAAVHVSSGFKHEAITEGVN